MAISTENSSTISKIAMISSILNFQTESLLRDKISRIYRENLTKRNYIFQDINIKNFSGNSVFTIFLKKHINRNILIKHLKFNKIPYKIYYAQPIHKSKFYKKFPSALMKNTLTLSKNTISLPIYPYLDISHVIKICKILNSFDE